MPDRLSPIAVRAWAHPPRWKPTRRRRPGGTWPQAAFLFTTIPSPCPGEPLRFGACALLPSLIPGQRPADLRLFVADDCPDAERAVVTEAAASHGLPPPLSRSELVELLLKRTYKQRLPLVGFGIPAHLGRVAAGWQPARGGGFSLILGTLPCPPGRRSRPERRRRPPLPNGEIENGDWPRVTVKPLDGQRAVSRFQGRGRPDVQDRAPDGEAGRPQPGYVYPGMFVDLATLATVQAAGERFPSVAAAARLYGLSPRSVGTGSSGALAHGEVEDSLAELDDLAALYLRLLDCHRHTPGADRVNPAQVYSAASYAEALFETVGLDLPLARSELPDSAHAHGMGAFFGGDCGVAVRHVDVPVAYLDITGHYPVSAHFAGTFELLRATKLELVEEDPAELQRFVASLTPERLQSEPALWKRLARTFCLITPDGDLLPHRIPNGKSLLLKTAPLHDAQPLPYSLADLTVSTPRTGLLPEIISAFSIRPARRHRKRLRPVTLPSGRRFDPHIDDLFLFLAEERLRLKHDTTLSPRERERQAKVIKLLVNAACYGLLCQINVQTAAGEMEITSLDGTTRTIRVDSIEEPGRWTAPLLAAGVTATGRLLLQVCRLSVEQAGGTVCSWDTDSLCVTGLDDGQLAEVQAGLERLSPYSPELKPDPAVPLLLALEPENYDGGRRVDLHLWATAAKNYDLHTREPDGTLTLRKTSEHGLGHLRTPGRPERDDRSWITDGRRHILACHLGMPTERPAWWDEPAISVITLNRPSELGRLQSEQSRGSYLRPFSRIAVAHPTAQYARESNGNRRTPVAPFHTGFDPATATWRDLTTGEPLAIRPAGGDLSEADLTTAQAGRVLCDTVGLALERNSRRPEAKAVDEYGEPCGRATTGILRPAPTEAIRHIPVGKEARNLERAGITEDPAHTLYTDPDLDAWKLTILPALRRLAPGLIPRGRPSRHQRAQLSAQAAQLARAALHDHDPSTQLPREGEQACYLYLKMCAKRTCACGCGEPVGGRARYAAPAHRTRAYRSRRFESDHPAAGVGADGLTLTILPPSLGLV